MPIYVMTAKVDQIVTKEVEITVEARSKDEAEVLVTKALQTYPAEIDTDSISRIVTVQSTYWTPRSVTVKEKTSG